MFLLIFLTNTMQLILSCKAQSDPYLVFWVLLGSILPIYKNEKPVNIWFLQLLFDFCCSFLLCCNLIIYILAHNVANCKKNLLNLAYFDDMFHMKLKFCQCNNRKTLEKLKKTFKCRISDFWNHQIHGFMEVEIHFLTHINLIFALFSLIIGQVKFYVQYKVVEVEGGYWANPFFLINFNFHISKNGVP